MISRSMVRVWNGFFFAPQSPAPIALYRILYGLLIVADLLLVRGDWLTWYGTRAFMGMDTMRKLAPGPRLNIFLLLPQDDGWIQAFFWAFLLFAVFLTAGFMSRLSSVVVFVFLFSIHQRNPYILHSGDTLLRAAGFFLMFAPTGAAISIDRLLRVWRGKEGVEPSPVSPWAQRLIQIQTALVYFATFYAKMLGTEWIKGTALYYTMRLVEFQRFPTPVLENGVLLRLATWSALTIEFALGVLVWFRKLRYWVLFSGVCLHLSIEYSMNIPLFQWIIMASYVTFIDPADLRRAWEWVRHRLADRLGSPVDMIYDGSCVRALRQANILRAIDVFGRLNALEVHSAEARKSWPALAVSPKQTTVTIGVHGVLTEGFKGLLAIARLIPLLWVLAPLSFVSGQHEQSWRVARAAKPTD